MQFFVKLSRIFVGWKIKNVQYGKSVVCETFQKPFFSGKKPQIATERDKNCLVTDFSPFYATFVELSMSAWFKKMKMINNERIRCLMRLFGKTNAVFQEKIAEMTSN